MRSAGASSGRPPTSAPAPSGRRPTSTSMPPARAAATPDARSPEFGRTATINMLMPFGDATYNSLQTQLTRRLSDSSLLGMAYTWSKAMNYADNSDSGLTWNCEPMWERNRALADFDRTAQSAGLRGLRAAVRSRQEMGDPGRWPPRSPAGGRSTVCSARPAGFRSPSRRTRPRSTRPATPRRRTRCWTPSEILGGVGRGNSYFDPDAFAPVTAVRFGNSGRNSLRGPGLVNLDASLFRDFAVGGGTTCSSARRSSMSRTRPAFNNPGANASNADPRRRWHHPQLERLYRDHVGPGDGTAGPVRPQGQVLMMNRQCGGGRRSDPSGDDAQRMADGQLLALPMCSTSCSCCGRSSTASNAARRAWRRIWA